MPVIKYFSSTEYISWPFFSGSSNMAAGNYCSYHHPGKFIPTRVEYRSFECSYVCKYLFYWNQYYHGSYKFEDIKIL